MPDSPKPPKPPQPAQWPKLDDLLVKTSRTFAASIPLLPERLHEQVGLAYLLFRIADTFEDGTDWPAARRDAALAEFDALLDPYDPDRARRLAAEWAADPPMAHDGYTELLAETPWVLERLHALADAPRERIVHHTRRCIDGMREIVARTGDDGRLVLRDLDDLRRYCYYVAGLVGEMLTDLFVLDCERLRPVEATLQARARLFGEGLQLVNILKDSAGDAVEGRTYLPSDVARASVFALARSSLRDAARYLMSVYEARPPAGVVRFLALPLMLAWATLDRVERDGSGAKLTRDEVLGCLAAVRASFDPERDRLTRRALRDLFRRVFPN